MKSKIYLIATKAGVIRLTRREPQLSRNEIAVAIQVTIPDSAFRSPILAATLDIQDEHTIQPTAEVIVVPEPLSAPTQSRTGDET